jgi:hypothetical protein
MSAMEPNRLSGEATPNNYAVTSSQPLDRIPDDLVPTAPRVRRRPTDLLWWD